MLLLQLSPLLDGPCGLADTVDRTAEFAQDNGEKNRRRGPVASKACSSSVPLAAALRQTGHCFDFRRGIFAG